ncbi:hypothetical protein BUALT_Bualt03G0230400 [Buddleja alternifolia]|uniref:Protein FAR1-RELATED SEQUENCE n=1 Tax=Buddleja alternifolia TaxID=168488 RepID=A0AAV6Y6V0_9LAMI|nr:hypothetical protein BUALT_Bualt03G0230400 [Buddleja alternifolia]
MENPPSSSTPDAAASPSTTAAASFFLLVATASFILKMEDMSFNGDDDKILTPTKSIPIPPCVGMQFECYDDAYDFYNLYAKNLGFGVRVKSSYKGRNTEEKQGAILCCVHQGFKEDNEVNNPRPGKRIGCQAMMRIKVSKLRKWMVTEVILDHNHNTTPSSVRFYKSHKNMSKSVKKKLELNCDSGIRINKTYHSLIVQAGGPEKLAFDEKDVRNYVAGYKRLKLVQGDAQAMYDYFCHMQMKNQKFFYLLDFDDESRLKNIFWADARSRVAYEFFGDAITFDTTYLTNKYDMPFAPFVGVNQHGQSVLLGCGLLADETTESFVWLFNAWLTCMGGRAPHAIITDQCKAMQIAIAQVFPRARHRLCLWHILQKVPQKLNGYNEYKSIKHAMEAAVYDSLRVSEFEQAWKEMNDDHGLGDNEWLQSLYDDKEKWVPVYLRGTFFAGMFTTQRSESMNAFFDGYVHSRTTLSDFDSKYTVALKDKYQKEAKADFHSRHSEPFVKTKCLYENQLSKIYTHNIFKKFQVEVEEMFSCFNVAQVKSEGSIVTYIVKERVTIVENMTRIVDYEVLYNTTEVEIHCICNLFNFKGYLCRHTLSVFHHNGIEEIPMQYIVPRWRKDFKRQYLQEIISNDVDYDNSEGWYDELLTRAIQLVEEGVVSKKHFTVALQELRNLPRNFSKSRVNNLKKHPKFHKTCQRK